MIIYLPEGTALFSTGVPDVHPNTARAAIVRSSCIFIVVFRRCFLISVYCSVQLAFIPSGREKHNICTRVPTSHHVGMTPKKMAATLKVHI